VADSFEDTSAPLFTTVARLAEQTRTLCQVRDLLLPKLVTGQIDVSDLAVETVTSESA
jgi:type I restriction enzyme S subunit